MRSGPGLLLGLLFFCATERLIAQEIDPEIGGLLDIDDDLLDEEERMELERLRQYPVDMNSAAREELERLPYLTEDQIQAIIEMRSRRGPFPDMETLGKAVGLDRAVSRRMEPFTVFRMSRATSGGRWRLMSSRSEKQGNVRARRINFRSDMRWGEHGGGGVVFEKTTVDTRPRWRSGYMSWSGAGTVEQIMMGWLDVEYGQGLTAGFRSLFPNVHALDGSIARHARGLRPAATDTRSGMNAGIAVLGLWRGVAGSAVWLKGREGGANHILRIGRSQEGKEFGMTFSSGMSEPPRLGVDWNLSRGPAVLFGETVWTRSGYSGAQSGMRWKWNVMDAGVVWRHFPRLQEDARGGGWVRARPDRHTVALLGMDYSSNGETTEWRRTLRLRRRIRPSFTLSAMWRQTVLDAPVAGNRPERRIQGQADWRMSRSTRLRGVLDYRRTSDNRIFIRYFFDFRYQGPERVSFTPWWQIDTRRERKQGAVHERAHRTRWGLLMQFPLLTGGHITVRYTQSRSFRFDSADLRETQMNWMVQADMAW